MKAVWNDIKKKRFNSLDGDIKTDVLVVGGGMCGILCARLLKDAGVDCVIVEADRICSGVTNGTTAKITLQHGLIYNKIMEKYGFKKTCMYYQSQKKAFDKMTGMVAGTDADLSICDSFVYSLKDRDIVEKELEALAKIGCEAELCEKTEVPLDIAGAVKIKNQATFHPLKFVYEVSNDLKIYENTRVLKVKPNEVITDNGRITAKKIIVATHFPILNRHGSFYLKMYQHRSYVIALENAQEVKGIYVDQAKEGLSFRNYGPLLLLGGGGHRTGKEGGGWEELRSVAKKYYPGAREVGNWATQDCMTLDLIPYIGMYSKLTPNLYVATGFNKWGMTSSMVAAMILTDMICARKNEYEEVYLPSRSIFHPQLAVNIIESVKDIVTPTVPRCPHMGCALKYNKAERSWDCPCHGSRFDDEGKVLDTPAVKNKKQ